MAKRDVLYHKVPVKGKKNSDYEYVKDVDIDRLHPGMHLDVYTKHRNTHGHIHYYRVQNVAGVLKSTLDTSTLDTTVEHIMNQLRDILLAQGKHGERTWNSIKEGFPVLDLVARLAEGDVEAATEPLEQMLYTLMSIIPTLCNELQKATQLASGLGAAVEQWAETSDHVDEIAGEYMLEWGASAEAVYTSATTLQGLETSLNEIKTDLVKSKTQVTQNIATAHALNGLQGYIEGDDTHYGFLLTVMEYGQKETQISRNDMQKIIAVTQQKIHAYRTFETLVKKSWEAHATKKGTAILADKKRRTLLATLENATKELRKHEKKWGDKTLRPYTYGIEAEGDEPLMTEDQYKTALLIIKDARWSPLRSKNRFDGLVSSILNMIADAPMLPEELTRLVDDAEGKINRLQLLWNSEKTQPTPPRARRVGKKTSIGRPRPTEMKKTTAESAVDPDRAAELYELLICVGLQLTCKKAFMAKSTVKSMFHVLRWLDLVTHEDMEAFFPAVNELSKKKGERETVHDTRHVTHRWNVSTAHWIQFRVKNKWCIKLTVHAKSETEALLKKHNLTLARIKEAHEMRDQERKEAYAARKQQRQRGNTDTSRH